MCNNLIKLTLAQFSPKLGDKKYNLERITEYMEKANKQNSDIIIFPELCLSGFLIEDFLDEISESINGPSLQYVKKICSQLKIHTVFTFPQKAENGLVYNSAALIDDMGQIIGVYNKVHLFDFERRYISRGSEFPVFQTKLGKIGIAICYDLEFPETARILRLNGAEIIFSATNNMAPYQDDQAIYVKSRAKENQIPVAICNRIGSELNYNFFGESVVADAFGKTILSYDDKENIKTVEVDLNPMTDPKLGYIANRQPGLYKKLID